MKKLLSVFAVLVATVACSETDFRSLNDDKGTPAPDITVEPMQLDFGTLQSGAESVQSFTVRNDGESVLDVTDIFIETGEDSFTLLGGIRQFLLDPGEEIEMAVAFTPNSANENFGQAIVESDDPDEAQVPVDLEGFGAVPELRIDPDPHDFGASFVPCASEQTVTLENIGLEPLEVTNITYKNIDGFLSLTNANTLPFTLGPTETADVLVAYVPGAPGNHLGTMSVTSNDPRGVVDAKQSGEGVYASETTDSFVVPDNPPVDIVFAVDQSCSMDGEAAVLGSAFGQFINEINNVTQGWQIGVTTLDDGCFNSGILTATTPNYQSLFASAVTVGTDSQVSTDEMLLEQAHVALTKTANGQCNQGFLRSGALLHIITVSDEREQSGTSAAGWLNNYAPFVSAQSLLKVSAIVDVNYNCGDGSGPGGYLEAANLTGGEVLNICDSNWGNNTVDLALASLTALNEYPLSQTPDPASLQVIVDGQPWQTGWHYDPATNSIVIDDPSQLEGGDDIEVSYGITVACP